MSAGGLAKAPIFDAEFVALLSTRAQQRENLHADDLAEWLIHKGSNPFRVWRHVRKLDHDYLSRTLGVEDFDIRNFEHGIFDDLSADNVMAFCEVAKIRPVDLIAPEQPLPPALLESLLGIVENPALHTPLTIEKTAYALLNHADEAGMRLNAEIQSNDLDDHLLVRQFLNVLRQNDGRGMDEAEIRGATTEVFERDVLLCDFDRAARSRYDETKRENERLWGDVRDSVRLFSDYSLRLFGTSANALSGRMDYLARLFPPQEFIRHMKRDPEIIFPLTWGGGAHMIGGRIMDRKEAVNGLADLFSSLSAKQELRAAGVAECKVMNRQIQILNDWADHNETLFAWYTNRQVIYAHKRRFNWGEDVEMPEPIGARRLNNILARAPRS